MSGIESSIVVGQFLLVLEIVSARMRDGRHAEAVQIDPFVRAVALEIALERSVGQRQGHGVVRFGEVVHADVDIARTGQLFDGELEQLQFHLGIGQLVLETFLERLDPRDVGIAVDGEAVGRKRQRILQGLSERFDGLVGQAVDQVEVDRLHAAVAQPLVGLAISSSGWMRVMVFCTSGLVSCTPSEARLNPALRRACTFSRVSAARIDFCTGLDR